MPTVTVQGRQLDDTGLAEIQAVIDVNRICPVSPVCPSAHGLP